MNSNEPLEQLEQQMESWKPRRPSPRLELRLFGGTTAGVPASVGGRWPGWGWLAPVACLCTVLVQLAVHPGNREFDNLKVSPASLISQGFAPNSFSAYASGWFHSDRNGLLRDTFEWTNRTTAPSTTRSLPAALSLTNSL